MHLSPVSLRLVSRPLCHYSCWFQLSHFPPVSISSNEPFVYLLRCLLFAFCLCVSVVFSHLFAVNWITFVFLSQILILDRKLAIIQVLCVLFPPPFGVCFWLPLHLTSLLWPLSSARPFCSELPLCGYLLLSRESHMGKIPVDKQFLNYSDYLAPTFKVA